MILVVSAPSGAGKTTLIKKLLDESTVYEFSVSTTTRPKRSGETEGCSYYYVSEEVFREMMDNDEFIEWAEVHGNYYGSTKKEVDRILSKGRIPVFDIDIQGCKLLKGKLENAIYVFIVPPSFTVLKERLVGRKSDSSEQIGIRLNNAKSEMLEYTNFDYIVINNDLDEAYGKLKSIVEAESCRVQNHEKLMKSILEESNDYTT